MNKEEVEKEKLELEETVTITSEAKKLAVAVIGVGKIGKPLLRQIHESNVFYRVVGLDINSVSVEGIENTLVEITSDRSVIGEMDIVIICIPSSNDNIEEVIEFILELDLKAGALLIIETTLPVGATEHIIDKITNAGSILGEDIFISYSPERIDTLEWNEVTAQIKIVSANDPSSLTKASSFYQLIGCDVTEINHTRKAEAVKLYENFSRLAQIEFANEFATFCVENNVPPIEIMMKAMTKTNVTDVLPGLVGGHCLPDNARMVAMNSDSEILRGLAFNSENRLGKGVGLAMDHIEGVKKPKVLLLGIGYKPKIKIFGEFINQFGNAFESKVKVTYFDVYMNSFPRDIEFKKYDVIVTFHKVPFYIKIIENYMKDDGLLIDYTGAYFGLSPLYTFP